MGCKYYARTLATTTTFSRGFFSLKILSRLPGREPNHRRLTSKCYFWLSTARRVFNKVRRKSREKKTRTRVRLGRIYDNDRVRVVASARDSNEIATYNVDGGPCK